MGHRSKLDSKSRCKNMMHTDGKNEDRKFYNNNNRERGVSNMKVMGLIPRQHTHRLNSYFVLKGTIYLVII